MYWNIATPNKQNYMLDITIKCDFRNVNNKTIQYILGDSNGKILNKEPIKLMNQITQDEAEYMERHGKINKWYPYVVMYHDGQWCKVRFD